MTCNSIMVVAGDPSGDVHFSSVIKQLRAQDSTLNIWGIGGPCMAKEGFTPLLPFEPFNKMGYAEVISHLGFFLNAKKMLIREMEIRKPACLVCVDYPGLNMIMMKAAKKAGIPVVWYIAPMVWAWKKKRAKILGQCASHIACIFPFEVDYFLPYTNNVSFVGNPTVEAIENTTTDKYLSVNQSFSIAIIPGSRKQEVERLLEPMLEAYKILKMEYPYLNAIVSHFPALDDSVFKIAQKYDNVTITTAPLKELFKKVDCAIVTSGTATLETALNGVPMVIAYKTSAFTYYMLRMLIKVSHIGLPNIIVKREIVPECIQKEMAPEVVASRVRKFITDKDYYKTSVNELNSLKQRLGEKRPSVEVAKIISTFVNTK